MCSQQVFTQAARGRRFDFVLQDFEFIAQDGLSRIGFSEVSKLAGISPASRLQVRAAPEMVSSGIAEIDSLTGGLPRGCLSEICGSASSGRTSLLLAAMAAVTKRLEVCALVDSSDTLSPQSAAAAGLNLNRLLWVRCSPSAGGRHGRTRQNHFDGADEQTNQRAEFFALENVLRVTDLLLQSSGFGLVAIDLSDVPYKVARRIPLTSWFRFRRAVENTSTVLLVISRQSCAAACASLLLQLEGRASGFWLPASSVQCQSPGFRLQVSAREPSCRSSETAERKSVTGSWPTHAEILEGLHIRAELLRSRLERKPVRSVSAAFATKSASNFAAPQKLRTVV